MMVHLCLLQQAGGVLLCAICSWCYVRMSQGGVMATANCLFTDGAPADGVQPPLCGFNRVDGLRLLHPDRLHVHGAGIANYLLEAIVHGLTKAQRDSIDRQLRLAHIRQAPHDGLAALDKRIPSKERFQLLKAIVPAISALRPAAAGAITGVRL